MKNLKLILLTLFIFVSGLNLQAQDRKAMFFNKNTGSTYVFDAYSNGLVGFSLHKLRASQVYCMRIERPSDNAQTDVELYDTGIIDLSSTVSAGGDLGTWVGSQLAYVVTWYDQSGNGNDVTQTAATAPNIIRADGVFETAGTVKLEGIRFDQTIPESLTRASLTELNDGNDITIFSISAGQSALEFGCIISTSTSTSRLQQNIDLRTNKRAIFVLASTNAFADLPAQNTSVEPRQLTSFVDGSNKDLTQWEDGVAGGADQAWTGTYTNDAFSMGVSATGNDLNGYIIELIIFSDDKTGDRTAIETNQNTRHGL